MGNFKNYCLNLCSKRKLGRVCPEESDGVNGKPASARRKSQIRRRTNAPPPPQYGKISEVARRTAPAALQCALFCGGRRCKYEQPDNWKPNQMAIQGVYSNWITDDILAMARPSTSAIASRNILQQFHSWGIRTIVNLQTPGEHASCGPPLQSSGFTYDPAVFMDNDIYYYNFAWEDYGEASLSSLLDMVKVLAFSVSEGRVAIHCHAGLGRTGVLISCYMVHAMRVRANDAVRLVRRRRARSVQTSRQIQCVQQFEHYILPQTVVFSSKNPLKEKKSCEFTLRQHLFRQRAILHGLEERAFKDLPRIIYCLCERLLKLCECDGILDIDYQVKNLPFTRSFLVVHIMKPTCEEIPSPEVSPREDTSNLTLVEWKEHSDPDLVSPAHDMESKTTSRGSLQVTAVQVAKAFLVDHYHLPKDRRIYMKQFQSDLNQREAAIQRIQDEDDPVILSGLLLEWLEGLKAPVLDRIDLAVIVSRGEFVENCVHKLTKEDVILLEYLIRFVIRLRPLSTTRRVDILKRLTASLTHQTVSIGEQNLPSGKEFPKLRDGTYNNIMNFFLRMMLELQKNISKPGADDEDVVVARVSKRVEKTVKAKVSRPC